MGSALSRHFAARSKYIRRNGLLFGTHLRSDTLTLRSLGFANFNAYRLQICDLVTIHTRRDPRCPTDRPGSRRCDPVEVQIVWRVGTRRAHVIMPVRDFSTKVLTSGTTASSPFV